MAISSSGSQSSVQKRIRFWVMMNHIYRNHNETFSTISTDDISSILVFQVKKLTKRAKTSLSQMEKCYFHGISFPHAQNRFYIFLQTVVQPEGNMLVRFGDELNSTV